MSNDANPSIHAHTAHTKHERRKDARPGELVDAALELFVQKGFAATRVGMYRGVGVVTHELMTDGLVMMVAGGQ